MIRILHAIGNMNRGGAETLIMNLYRNIDRSRIQFDFLVHRPTPGAFEEEILELGGRIFRVPYGIGSGHFAYVRALDRFFREHPEYKIVHSHMNEASGIILRSAKKAKVPVRIAHSHTSYPMYPLVKKLYFQGYARKLLPRNANHYFACSSRAGEYLFGDGIARSGRMTLLRNGVAASEFSFDPNARAKTRAELGLHSDAFVIGHIGSFRKVKNHTFLLDVFAEISQRQKNAVLALAGDGELRQEMERKADLLGVRPNVRFLGVRDDVQRIMQAIDVFVLPSLYEGLPVTLVEAQSAGLRCVISDTITKEADFGAGLIEYAALNDIAEWTCKILQPAVERRDTAQLVRNSGYEIKDICESVQKFYINAWR
ncbi:glycosyltransferase family 1 protein [Paenibacillus sp.]|uniref:glycosyltransferase family 1 protein n=1 Tax=Paenibacillus sp. TaxID=58172 RepID=UPI0028115859|nr:glycosyltransferase family 1 protein [Paenibacillus sp.]